MTRGNQRDVDRERARKRKERNEGARGNSHAGMDLAAERERTAEIMRQKQQAADARKSQ
ncbi:4F5 protein family protein [Giardia muris]|uniref:4F5 protein family protein n=1 Tax=Giardia muris TaxID=5742 RepID=A0A4Z1SV29_GIAMU|nr:4F5 protein family protein [Giardia muris]|eukprot:TNJ27448.1 4F5 protein family protein [Giardia muris]